MTKESPRKSIISFILRTTESGNHATIFSHSNNGCYNGVFFVFFLGGGLGSRRVDTLKRSQAALIKIFVYEQPLQIINNTGRTDTP